MYVVCVWMYVVICKIDHCIHIHWCIVMGLGHNDPWVESHMWPQQTWGQRSSRGQWPLVQVFGKKGQCIHILWCIFKSIKYYNDCKSMWSRKQARLVVREPPCFLSKGHSVRLIRPTKKEESSNEKWDFTPKRSLSVMKSKQNVFCHKFGWKLWKISYFF